MADDMNAQEKKLAEEMFIKLANQGYLCTLQEDFTQLAVEIDEAGTQIPVRLFSNTPQWKLVALDGKTGESHIFKGPDRTALIIEAARKLGPENVEQ